MPWLERNIDTLSERLGLSLEFVEREKSAGPFSVDILAEEEGRQAIIECQFGKSDHDHLGKVLTYLTNLDATIAIWICEDPRPEHMDAVNWLNEFSPKDVSFYLVKLEGIRIGDSNHAPLFSVVCSPSEYTKKLGEKKRGIAEAQTEAQEKRLTFW
ncbi:MAG: DUF4268 domain-containing protein, partial [Thermoplasmata archaeon]